MTRPWPTHSGGCIRCGRAGSGLPKPSRTRRGRGRLAPVAPDRPDRPAVCRTRRRRSGLAPYAGTGAGLLHNPVPPDRARPGRITAGLPGWNAMPHVVRSVVERHAAEAAFVWFLRDRALTAPQYQLADLRGIDRRLDAHLDGLRVAGGRRLGIRPRTTRRPPGARRDVRLRLPRLRRREPGPDRPRPRSGRRPGQRPRRRLRPRLAPERPGRPGLRPPIRPVGRPARPPDRGRGRGHSPNPSRTGAAEGVARQGRRSRGPGRPGGRRTRGDEPRRSAPADARGHRRRNPLLGRVVARPAEQRDVGARRTPDRRPDREDVPWRAVDLVARRATRARRSSGSRPWKRPRGEPGW